MTKAVLCFALQLYFTLILCLCVVSEMFSNRQHVTKTIESLTL